MPTSNRVKKRAFDKIPGISTFYNTVMLNKNDCVNCKSGIKRPEKLKITT